MEGQDLLERVLPREAPSTKKSLNLLIVSPVRDDYRPLEPILGEFGWEMPFVNGCHEALTFLQWNLVAILICDGILPDGSWKDILQGVSALSRAPRIVVASKLADAQLWAEVLNWGAHDLLIKPFDLEEASRVITSAWLHWKGGGARWADT